MQQFMNCCGNYLRFWHICVKIFCNCSGTFIFTKTRRTVMKFIRKYSMRVS